MIETSARFQFSAVPEQLSAARNCIRGFLTAQGWGSQEMDVNIAAGEVMQNIIRYGFSGGDPSGFFTIEMSVDGDELGLSFTDTAPPSDPKTWSAEHRNAEDGGHGLAMVRAVVDSYEFKMLENGNQAKLVFKKQG